MDDDTLALAREMDAGLPGVLAELDQRLADARARGDQPWARTLADLITETERTLRKARNLLATYGP